MFTKGERLEWWDKLEFGITAIAQNYILNNQQGQGTLLNIL